MMEKIDFENGKVWKNIINTSLPMLIAQVTTLLYNIVDRIFIGRLPGIGTAALGSVGLTFPVIILITGFTNMYGLGGSPLFSMELGRKNKEKASAIINTAFRLEIITALIIIAVGEIFAPLIICFFGAKDAEMFYALPYLRIYLVGTLFSMIATGMNPFITAQGYSATAMLTVVVGASVNIGLDPVLMFALGMGVKGAALATVTSQLLSCFLVMRFLLGDKNEYRLIRKKYIPIEKGIRESALPYATDITVLGMSSFVMQATNALVSICCNNVLINIGGASYVSVMTVITSVRQILDAPSLAFTDGASPTISYNYGARKYKNVLSAILLMSIIAISYTAVMWFMIERFPKSFLGIFTSDEELIGLALIPLHLYFFAFVFQALQYCGQTVFKSLGKKKFAIFFSIFRKVVLVVPLTFMLPYMFSQGTDGVFIAEPISNFIGGSACFVTMLIIIVPSLMRNKAKEI